MVACQALLFPILHRHLGSVGLLRASMPFFTAGVCILPLAAYFAHSNQKMAEMVVFSAALAMFTWVFKPVEAFRYDRLT